MKTTVKAAIVAGLSLLPITAHASMTVTPALTVKNACREDIMFAVHYKDRSEWATTPFIRIAAGQQNDRVVSSDNSIFYYYAESATTRWAGNENKMVRGKMYPMRKKMLEFDAQRNRYYLALTCNSR